MSVYNWPYGFKQLANIKEESVISRKIFKLIRMILILIIMLSFFYVINIVFSYPEKTEIRLFIDHWKELVLSVAIVIGCFCIMNSVGRLED